MIFFDFEYNEKLVLMCIAQTVTKDGSDYDYFDLREAKGVESLKNWIAANEDQVFVSYALNAEIESLLRLGIDVTRMKCIDLMAECRMITMSHDRYFTADSSLLGQVRAILKHDIKEDKAHKEAMRELILSKTEWTESEWDSITLYCFSDIEHLEKLMKAVIQIHKNGNHPYSLDVACSRGHYVRICAEMDFASKGFPVYGDDIHLVYGNKDAVRDSIIFNLPPLWKSCFVKKKGGGWTLSRKRVAEVISQNKWDWKRTETGLPVLETEYLSKLKDSMPVVKPLYSALQSLTTLNSSDLRDQIVDGYIKPRTFAFSAKTGRNGLKPKHGFLLNLPSWMRRMIRPHPGMLLVGVDWSQQEIAIAAALSGDKKLIEAYKSGDVYLTLGKMAGVIPEDGTKKSHKKERDMFKALQLALGYGKGVKSLGVDFYNIMKDDGVDLSTASIKAQEIYNWHQLYFTDYWTWIRKEVSDARLRGWISSKDDWVEWVSSRTLTTQLLNFPSQANGAAMLRLATLEFYRLWKAGEIDVLLCSQHDAFYFNMPAEKEGTGVVAVKKVMKNASEKFINLEVRSDEKVFTTDRPYTHDGWTADHEKLWNAAILAGKGGDTV